MSGVLVGLVLAVAASLALNGAYLLQHAGAAAAPRITPRHPLRAVRGLLRSRVWLGGLALALSGWCLHVAALSQAPLALVQAFVAGGLVLAVPLAVGVLRHPLTSAERIAVCLMAFALVLLSVGLAVPSSSRHIPIAALGGYVAGACGVSAALAAVARGGARALALGIAGGILYGVGDLAIKALTSAGVLLSPWLLVVAVATAGAFFCFQRALQIGRALPVIALMTAATNVVSILGGLLILGEPLGATPSLAILHALAFVLVAGSAWMLAPTQAILTGTRPGSGPVSLSAAGQR